MFHPSIQVLGLLWCLQAVFLQSPVPRATAKPSEPEQELPVGVCEMLCSSSGCFWQNPVPAMPVGLTLPGYTVCSGGTVGVRREPTLSSAGRYRLWVVDRGQRLSSEV